MNAGTADRSPRGLASSVDWDRVVVEAGEIAARFEGAGLSDHERLDAMAGLLWRWIGDERPVAGRRAASWVGFYEIITARHVEEGRHHGGVVGEEMVLGPHRPKPACSPLGVHGACGRAALSGKTLIVADVAALGDGYVACDPRDASEVIVPLFEHADSEEGNAADLPARLGGRRCWGVLDADSFAAGAFGEEDARQLERVCLAAGVTAGRGEGEAAVEVVG